MKINEHLNVPMEIVLERKRALQGSRERKKEK